jgi:hypothetical protein
MLCVALFFFVDLPCHHIVVASSLAMRSRERGDGLKMYPYSHPLKDASLCNMTCLPAFDELAFLSCFLTSGGEKAQPAVPGFLDASSLLTSHLPFGGNAATSLYVWCHHQPDDSLFCFSIPGPRLIPSDL